MAAQRLLSERIALREMHKPGFFRPFSQEVTLYMIIGPEDFKRIINTSFEYACLEYEHFGLLKRGANFTEICQIRRADIIAQALAKVKEFEDREFYFNPPTREDMIEMIKEQYSQSTLSASMQN
ncbi:MAG: hypothetical protein PHH00_04275 [Candidatus Nanoarchaeia archaeon]|nr:hypothetical protein [Candidatus Nanoarchaeia archaeon]